MILDNYTDGVVLICSMPRSGSTILGVHIQKKFNILNGGEVFHSENPDAQETAKRVLQQVKTHNKDFVCKYFPANDVFDQSVFFNKKIYTVNLVRENVARQFTSLIIAITTDRWQDRTDGLYKKGTDKTRRNVNIDTNMMQREFKKYINSLLIKQKFDSRTEYDEVLIYEDIVDYLNENKRQDITNIPTVQPINYNHIYVEVVNLFKEYAKNNNNTIPELVAKWYDNFQQNGFRA